jgi:hypothetical protein
MKVIVHLFGKQDALGRGIFETEPRFKSENVI